MPQEWRTTKEERAMTWRLVLHRGWIPNNTAPQRCSTIISGLRVHWLGLREGFRGFRNLDLGFMGAGCRGHAHSHEL